MKAVSLEVPGNLVGVTEKENLQQPINFILDRIDQVWGDSSKPNVLIVQAKTGSGKSVFMTKEIYKRFGVNVVVTEPTVINAIQIPATISQLYGVKLGEVIGYTTGAKKIIPQYSPNMMFVTQEVMNNQLRDQTKRFPPRVIVMDEAHHASIQAEQLLVYLRDLAQVSRTRADQFVVITSATIDVGKFCAYFGSKDTVTVTGFTFPKQIVYPPREIVDVEGYVANTVKEIVAKSGADDAILIFCPTASVIKNIKRCLKERLEDTDDRRPVRPKQDRKIKTTDRPYADDVDTFYPDFELDSEMGFGNRDAFDLLYHGGCAMVSRAMRKRAGRPTRTLCVPPQQRAYVGGGGQYKIVQLMADDVQRETENYQDAFRLASKNGWARKIILATDVAETGVTISDLKFVIDLGYNNFVFQNPCIDARIMINQFVESQDQFDQRSGRVGRTSQGTAYAMFPQSTYETRLRPFKFSGLETSYYYPLYMWLLENKTTETFSPRYADMESLMHKTLTAQGFLDGDQPTVSGRFFARTRLLTPNELHFVFMCLQHRIQVAEAVGMISAAGQTKVQRRDPLLMDDLLEGYLELGRLISEDAVTPEQETNIVKIIKKRFEIIINLRYAGIDCYSGDSYETVKRDRKRLVDYLRRLKRCIFFGFLSKAFVLDPEKMVYRSLYGVEMRAQVVQRKFGLQSEDFLPKVVVVNDVVQQFDMFFRMQYKFQGISVIDGFVPIDPDLFRERYAPAQALGYEEVFEQMGPVKIKKRIADYEALCEHNQPSYFLEQLLD